MALLALSPSVIIFCVLAAATVGTFLSSFEPFFYLTLPNSQNSHVQLAISFLRIANTTVVANHPDTSAVATTTTMATHVTDAAAFQKARGASCLTAVFVTALLTTILAGTAAFKAFVWCAKDPQDDLLARRVCVLTGLTASCSLLPLTVVCGVWDVSQFCADVLGHPEGFDGAGTWRAGPGLVGLAVCCGALLLTFAYEVVSFRLAWHQVDGSRKAHTD